MARFAFCAASSLIWGDGGLLFHFILSKIVDIVHLRNFSQNLIRLAEISEWLESYALHDTNDAIPLLKGWKESSKP